MSRYVGYPPTDDGPCVRRFLRTGISCCLHPRHVYGDLRQYGYVLLPLGGGSLLPGLLPLAA